MNKNINYKKTVDKQVKNKSSWSIEFSQSEQLTEMDKVKNYFAMSLMTTIGQYQSNRPVIKPKSITQ